MTVKVISVIIATRNRAAALQAALDSIARATVPAGFAVETLVVDNGSTDGTRATAQSYGAKYLHLSTPGAGRARNVALRHASGQFVFVTDDDCIATPDWFEVGCRLLSDDPRQVVGGRVTLHNPKDLPITVKLETRPETLTTVNDIYGFIHGCNMICGREVFDEIGLFDPRLGPGTPCRAADDTDVIYRAFRAGIPVRYCPDLQVAHHHGRQSAGDGDRINAAYMVSIGALTVKHLIRGRRDLARLLYWRMRMARRRGQPTQARHYAAGALAFLRSGRGGPP